jgi:hypothetical protein
MAKAAFTAEIATATTLLPAFAAAGSSKFFELKVVSHIHYSYAETLQDISKYVN